MKLVVWLNNFNHLVISAPLNDQTRWLSGAETRWLSGAEATMSILTNIMKGYVYILKCANDLYYTGSTNNIEKRILEHQSGLGANFTRRYLPVQLVYFEEFSRIGDAFYREKQIQGWNRKKKEALINGEANLLHPLAECKNDSHFKNK